MRQEYTPFLLPVLRELHGERDPGEHPQSPMAEERALLHRLDEPLDWDTVALRVMRAYGVRLLTKPPQNYTINKSEQSSGAQDPFRSLILETADEKHFLMEHPQSLECFDRLNDSVMRPAIARPSLFARLWREADGDSDADQPDQSSFGTSSSVEVLKRHIQEIIEKGQASDWHIEPTQNGYLSRVRIEGRLITMEKITNGKGVWLIQSFLAMAGLKQQPQKAQEGRMDIKIRERRLTMRLSFVPALHGASLVVRFLYPDMFRSFTLERLGMSPAVRKEIDEAFAEREGLWLVAGPTGSGKSTTLHALLQVSVGNHEKVLAVEDPVETTISGAHHLSIGSPPGLTYPVALRSFLRQSPDCVLIGEIRDAETAAIVLQAARTGHRVLSTVHARDNTSLMRRFEDLEQSAANLISVTRLILHQRLVPLLCESCKELFKPAKALQEALLKAGLPAPPKFAREHGCPSCWKGSKGRQAVFSRGHLETTDAQDQIMLLDPVWKLFRENRISCKSLLPFLAADLRQHFQIC